MEQHQLVFHHCQQIYSKLSHYYLEVMTASAREQGLESPGWYPLLAAYSFQPDPISVERLRVRGPFESPQFYAERLGELARNGCLRISFLGGYNLTPQGLETTENIIQAAYQIMSNMEPIPDRDLKYLTDALGLLIQACLIYGPQISKWSLIYSRRLDNAHPENLVAKADQYISDLLAYRDDAHLASWHEMDVPAHGWDILTLLWQETHLPVSEIRDLLEDKKWEQLDTLSAIDQLRQRGWISGSEELEITESGEMIRTEAEALTDEFFYAPWKHINQEILQVLSNLLPAFSDGVNNFDH